MASLALSLLVLTTLALIVGAFWLWRRGGSRKQVTLMLVLAVVMAVNVAIWTLPGQSGQSLVSAAKE
ncbi:hypothetical protein KRR38_10310 [Novosphingobium sp. G106]|uniref:hypothetical protein n=1 Tax=Novosphingobium sp. G106 TaxID=2849500 RepID=UPI001C2D14C3|nr:hypothetical protein [Novosphingobium sp. G106]MBV1688056.1 hypothetical protein [Novosphingobium sp. G106]